MTDPETPTQPLIRGRSATNEPAHGSSRAYKVAGFTLLACVLIVGQAMIAYFLLSQRNDIKSLEDQSNDLKSEMMKGRSGGARIQMQAPMQSLPIFTIDSLDEEASTGATEKSVSPQPTQCQLEAAGVKPMQVPGFRPSCDERGLYQAQQCFNSVCWCVNPANGEQIPGSIRTGGASCSSAVRGRMTKMLTLPDVTA